MVNDFIFLFGNLVTLMKNNNFIFLFGNLVTLMKNNNLHQN